MSFSFKGHMKNKRFYSNYTLFVVLKAILKMKFRYCVTIHGQTCKCTCISWFWKCSKMSKPDEICLEMYKCWTSECIIHILFINKIAWTLFYHCLLEMMHNHKLQPFYNCISSYNIYLFLKYLVAILYQQFFSKPHKSMFWCIKNPAIKKSLL